MNDEGDLWRLDESEVTMLRGTAVVQGSPCKIDLDLSNSEAVLTVGGDEGEQPSTLKIPVAIDPEVRHRLQTSLRDTEFYVGKHLRSEDRGVRLAAHHDRRPS